MDNADDQVPVDALNNSFDSVKSKRGRKAIPEKWTGVYLVPFDGDARYNISSIKEELEQPNLLPNLPRGSESKALWKLLFHPSKYLE